MRVHLLSWYLLLLAHGLKSKVEAAVSAAATNTPFDIPADRYGNTVPDFSHVGYDGGGVQLPDAPVVLALDPCERAIDLPSQTNCATFDDTTRIQRAINRVGKLSRNETTGIRGALLLRRGVYRVRGSLLMNETGVVLRGEGNIDGDRRSTTLLATGTTRRTFITLGASDPNDRVRYNAFQASAMIQRRPKSFRIVDQVVPVGAKTTLEVQAALTDLQAGNRILIYRPPSSAWLDSIGMLSIPARDPSAPPWSWAPNTFAWYMPRTIVSVRTNPANTANLLVTIDVALHMSLDSKFGGGFVMLDDSAPVDALVNNVGIEQILLKSEYAKGGEFYDEDHAETAVSFDRVANAWAADIVVKHFIHGFTTGYQSRHITIQDSSVLAPVSQVTGGRRYSYWLFGMFGLVQRCFASAGRHDFVTGARVQGPNVFRNSTSVGALGDTGPHERWAFGILYDGVRSKAIDCFNRNNLGTGQGWSGAFHVFWNCEAETGSFQAATGTSTWIVGFRGTRSKPVYVDPRFASTPQNATTISEGKSVQPGSLYLWQLEKRRGKGAVVNMSTSRLYRDYATTTTGPAPKGGAEAGMVTPTPTIDLSGTDLPWFLRRKQSSTPRSLDVCWDTQRALTAGTIFMMMF